jgi:DNA repair protein RadC
MHVPAGHPVEPNRPRERALVEGLDSLGDAELLALLLGTGTHGRSAVVLASDLLDALGGIEGLSALGLAGLAEHPGLGPAKAARVGAALELGRRALRRVLERPRAGLGSSAEVAAWAKARLVGLDHEEIWLLALDGRNQLRAARRIAQGGLHGCSISVRDPLRIALREAASSFVLVHNHPSGDPSPSREDLELTRAVARAGETVGTPLVDHVIVAARGHASLFDLGLIGSGP